MFRSRSRKYDLLLKDQTVIRFLNFSDWSINFSFTELQSQVIKPKSYFLVILSIFYADFFGLLHSPMLSVQLRFICSLINDEYNELLSDLHHQFETIIGDKSSVSRALPLFFLTF